MEVNKEVLLEGIKNYFKVGRYAELYQELMDASWIQKPAKLVALVVAAVVTAEQVVVDMEEVGFGFEKKKAVQAWLDEVIDLPFYLEPLDGPLAGIAIDGIVGIFNVVQKKNWLIAAKKFLGID